MTRDHVSRDHVAVGAAGRRVALTLEDAEEVPLERFGLLVRTVEAVARETGARDRLVERTGFGSGLVGPEQSVASPRAAEDRGREFHHAVAVMVGPTIGRLHLARPPHDVDHRQLILPDAAHQDLLAGALRVEAPCPVASHQRSRKRPQLSPGVERGAIGDSRDRCG